MVALTTTTLILLLAVQLAPNLVDGEPRRSLSKNCATAYTAPCLKLDLVSWLQKLYENMRVSPSVKTVSDSARIGDVARQFPNGTDAHRDAYHVNGVAGYLNSQSVRLNFWDATNGTVKEEGGGKDDDGDDDEEEDNMGGGIGMLMAAGAMVKAALMTLAMGGIAAVAGKALMSAIISLVLASMVGVKDLISGRHTNSHHQIMMKPGYAYGNPYSVSHQGGGHLSYSRSFDTLPLPLG